MDTAPDLAPDAPALEIHGDVQGSIVYGDHNFVVNTNNGTIIYNATRPQVNRRAAIPAPPRPPALFLNRTDESARLSAGLAERQPVALYGIEGAGKSTLLRHIAAAADPATYPDGVVLINGVGSSGVPQGLDDLAQSLFNALFESEPVTKVTAETARTHLSGVQALFVLDELGLPPETLDKLPDLIPTGALMWAAPHAPRGEMTHSLSLGGLPRAEAVALYLQIAELEPDPATDATIDEICRLSDDLPLAIISVARWTRERKSHPARALSILKGQQARREPDGMSRAATGVLIWLTLAARRLFGVAAAAGGPTIERSILIEASGLDQASATKGVDELLAYGMIQANSPELSLAPALKQFGRARYPAASARRQQLADIFLREAQARRGDWNYIRAQLGNLIGAFEDAVAGGRAAQAGAIARLIVPLLVLRGRWDLWHYIFERLAGAAVKSGDRALHAWALHEIGTRALGIGQPGPAARLLREALQIRESLGDHEGAEYTRHNLQFLAGPPPRVERPEPPPGRPWLSILIAAGLGGLGLVALVGVVVAALYCTLNPCLPVPPTPAPISTGTPTALVVVELPTGTGTPTAPAEPTQTPTRPPSATPTRRRPTLTPTVTRTPIPIQLTLAPIGDTYIDSLAPENNFGGQVELRVGYSPDVEFPSTTRTLITFDLSALPPGTTILSAAVGLTMTSEFDSGSADDRIVVYAVDQPWNELKVTWNNSPSVLPGEYAVTLVPAIAGYYEWEITDLVQAWVDGELTNYGLGLGGDETGEFNLRYFASRESVTDLPPLLLITYTPPSEISSR